MLGTFVNREMAIGEVMTEQRAIRNYSIIAHIDHGKSTLADRILEHTHAISPRLMKEQVLDSMDLERERGITIKARAVNLSYRGYVLNLIDTPGHVDFTHEVSRSLAACEGAVLVVDATKGVQAQTVSNFNIAMEENLVIIPVINKIDLQIANLERVQKQLQNIFPFRPEEIIYASAKTGEGVEKILDAVVERIPPPSGEKNMPLRAMIFDSVFDNYKGVLVFIRVVEGCLANGTKLKFMGTGKTFIATEVGVFKPAHNPVGELSAGMVGYIAANIRDVSDVRVGDTVTAANSPAREPLPGYSVARPMVFSSFYPAEGAGFLDLKEAIEKLRLNDSSFSYERENSPSLGYGFRCGFLGLLHLEIILARLEREYDLNLITAAPSVLYRIRLKNGQVIEADNPGRFPPLNEMEAILEFIVKTNVVAPEDCIGQIMTLCKNKRGIFLESSYLDENTVSVKFEMPIAEIMTDFFDKLKSVSSGYGSFEYERLEWRESNLVKLDVLINGELVQCFSSMVHRSKAYERARELVLKLKDAIPSHQIPVAIQAAVGGEVLARETKKAFRKDVTAKLYGGDVTRKRKLLEKQKKGKKKMKQFGKIFIPQEAFLAVLK